VRVIPFPLFQRCTARAVRATCEWAISPNSSIDHADLWIRNDPTYFFLDDVDVSPVPIPGAVWLLGSGIVELIGLKRRMRK